MTIPRPIYHIDYTDDIQEALERSYSLYQYMWSHIPSKETGKGTVYCGNEYIFMQLLSIWNSSSLEWKYWA